MPQPQYVTQEQLTATLAPLKVDIAALKTRASALEATVNNSTTGVAALNSAVAMLKQSLSSVTTELVLLQAEVDGLPITVMQNDIAVLKAKCADLQAQIDAINAGSGSPPVDPPPVDPPPSTFIFETPSVADPQYDVTAAANTVTVDLTGVTLTGNHLSLFNVNGNGHNPDVTVILPGFGADWFKVVPDTPAGGKRWQDTHASGDFFTLYGCNSFAINPPASGGGGTQPPSGGGGGGTTPSDPPDPGPQPPAPTSDSAFMALAMENGDIVYHCGTMAPPLPASNNPGTVHDLPGYSIGPVNVRGHWWLSRWRDFKSPITIIKSPRDLVDAHRVFPYGNIGVRLGSPQSQHPAPRQRYTNPMDACGLTKYMPTTGERPEIGVYNDRDADYMLGFDPSPAVDLGKAHMSVPIHFMDPVTKQPVDLLKYPSANAYSSNVQGLPWMLQGPVRPDGWPRPADGWMPQQAHYASLSYVIFQATHHPAFLEDMQYAANFMFINDAYNSSRQGKPILHGEYRGWSWGLRNLFQAHTATKDAEALGILPATCKPSSYFKALLDNQLAFVTAQINPADHGQQTFRLVIGPSGGRFAPWQQDYMISALGHGILTGHSDWVSIYLFALGSAYERMANIPGGYPPGFGDGYYFDSAQPDWMSAIKAGVVDHTDPATGAPVYLGGAEPATPAELSALAADPLNGHKALRGFAYLQATRAVLVDAQFMHNEGILDIKTTYPLLDQAVDNAHRMILNGGWVAPRQSRISDKTKVSNVIIPYTP